MKIFFFHMNLFIHEVKHEELDNYICSLINLQVEFTITVIKCDIS